MNTPPSPALAAALLGGLALSGCVTTRPYVPAPVDQSARIRFAGPQTSAVAVQVLGYPGGSCDAPMDLGLIDGLPSKVPAAAPTFPGAEEYREGSHFERLIPAGRPYLFTLGGRYASATLPTRWECTVTGSFVPQRGEAYEARDVWVGERCSVELQLIRAGADGRALRQPEASAQRAAVCRAGL